MKILMTLALCLWSFSSAALHLETQWNELSRKQLVLTCQEDSLCENFCEGQTCKIEEEVCKNCVGTSISMTYAFEEMGRSYVSTYKIDNYFIYDLLSSGQFVSISSRSIYNLVDRFDSFSLRRNFRSLCQDETKYPTVFFGKRPSGEIGEIQAVWCSSGVYRMEHLANISDNGPY